MMGPGRHEAPGTRPPWRAQLLVGGSTNDTDAGLTKRATLIAPLCMWVLWLLIVLRLVRSAQGHAHEVRDGSIW